MFTNRHRVKFLSSSCSMLSPTSRLSLASLDPPFPDKSCRRDRPSRSASIRSANHRSISRPSHAARRPRVERNGRRAESRAGEGRDWNSCCSIVLNWWRDTNARARNPSRRSNAISLDASYSRCLSAGTRVSLSFSLDDSTASRSRRKCGASKQKPAGVSCRRWKVRWGFRPFNAARWSKKFED